MWSTRHTAHTLGKWDNAGGSLAEAFGPELRLEGEKKLPIVRCLDEAEGGVAAPLVQASLLRFPIFFTTTVIFLKDQD